MKTPFKKLLGAALSLLVTFGLTWTVPSALAQTRGFSLPAKAQEIEPGVYYLGRVKDRKGRAIDGIAFVEYKKSAVKPAKSGGAGHTKSDLCYSFLDRGVHWKTAEDFVVSPTIADAPDGSVYMAEIGYALDNWEAAAGTQIFANATVGPVDLSRIGYIPNGVNEVTFAPISDPTVLAYTVVWGVLNGPTSDRQLTEWDMVLRDDVTFTVPGEPRQWDFWNAFAHESGHAAGLGHPSDTCTEETMYRYIGYGEVKKQTLNAGDIAGIQALYQ